MKLKAVAEYLQAQALGTIGTDIFAGEMPEMCKRGILLMDTYSGSRIDHELPGWRETGFRVVVRHDIHDAGEQLAEQVSAALTIQRDVVMGPLFVKQMLPYNDPKPYRRSEAGVWEFETDVETTYIRS
jgi:hypothetical protein